jgi:carboxyl-terminal processing protease
MRAWARRLTFTVVLVGIGATGTGQTPQAVETFDAAWRIVRDSHFDRTLNGVDWNAVSIELRPKAAAAKTAGDLRSVLREMLGRLGQSHFAVIPATADSVTDVARDLMANPGFDVRLVGRDLLVTEVDPGGAAAAAGVKTGWKVMSVDGAFMPSTLSSLSESLEPRVMQVEAWRLAQTRLRGPSGSRADITFEDGNGQSVALTVTRHHEGGQPVTVGNLPTMFVRVNARRTQTPGGRTAGIVGFNVWMAAVDALFAKAIDDFRTADGISSMSGERSAS